MLVLKPGFVKCIDELSEGLLNFSKSLGGGTRLFESVVNS
jgi:hypothetical protein